VGNLGFVTNRRWSDDDEGRALLTCLGNVIGLWATHPRSGAMDAPGSVGQREWSLAFTPRQKQILTLVGEGMSNTDIARRLIVSSSSVKQDLHQSMRALRTHSRQGAYERALSLGLLR
jgi:DNA-binding NarL/FixJ family response regulator